jgi:hypothetical protein
VVFNIWESGQLSGLTRPFLQAAGSGNKPLAPLRARICTRPFLQAAEAAVAWYPGIFGEVCFAWPIQVAFPDSADNNLGVVCATRFDNGADWLCSRDRLRASAFANLAFWRAGTPVYYSTSDFLSLDWNQRGSGNGNI